MHVFTNVTTIEIPIDTPMFILSLFMNAIPILMPKETPIKPIVTNHIKNLRSLFLARGKPTLFHFIY